VSSSSWATSSSWLCRMLETHRTVGGMTARPGSLGCYYPAKLATVVRTLVPGIVECTIQPPTIQAPRPPVLAARSGCEMRCMVRWDAWPAGGQHDQRVVTAQVLAHLSSGAMAALSERPIPVSV